MHEGGVVEAVAVELSLYQHAQQVVGGEAAAPLVDLLADVGVPFHEGGGGLGEGFGVGRALRHQHGV